GCHKPSNAVRGSLETAVADLLNWKTNKLSVIYGVSLTDRRAHGPTTRPARIPQVPCRRPSARRADDRQPARRSRRATTSCAVTLRSSAPTALSYRRAKRSMYSTLKG